MFEKNMRLAFLLDFYSELLDEHTGNIMKAYYHDDLSLAEIAEDEGISRQGVRHVIKKGEEQLEFYESRLGLSKKESEINSALDSLSEVKRRLEETNLPELSDLKLKLEKIITTLKS